MTVTSPIRIARHRAGFTIDRLAVAAGISRGTVHLAERAPQLTTRRTAERLAPVLGCTAEELLPGPRPRRTRPAEGVDPQDLRP